MTSRATWLVGVVLGFTTLFAAAGTAAAVTVGPTLNGDYTQTSFGGGPNTWINQSLAEAGTTATSPVDGVVIRWRMAGSFSGGPFRIRVVRPDGGGNFSAVATGGWETPAGAPATNTFAASLPIKAGDYIGIDPQKSSDKIGTKLTSDLTTKVEYFTPQLVDGGPAVAPAGFYSPGNALGFNADVLAPPTATAVAPTTGSVTGGTSVTVGGTNFDAVQSVSFGPFAAASYKVDSATQITAVAPAATGLGPIGITVKTAAGSATAQGFSYVGCRVPKLVRKKLAAAKKALKKAGCKLGKVKTKRGVKKSKGKVKSQSKKAGSVLAPGTKIALKLG